MARTLSRTLSLTRSSPGLIHRIISSAISQQPPFLSPTVGVSDRRYRSTRTSRGQLIEVDLESSSTSSDGDVDVLRLKNLEDVIHGIIVRQSAPDWLPFRPGSSYWVPPKPCSNNFREVFGKLAHPLTEEETLSFTSVRGWPASSFFIEEGASPVIAPVPMKVQLHVLTDSDLEKMSESEDEE